MMSSVVQFIRAVERDLKLWPPNIVPFLRPGEEPYASVS